MIERFGHDCLIALATCENNVPFVRTVDAFYEDGAFFVLTHALSNKMKQIDINPVIAVLGDWFTGHGTGENLGDFGNANNRPIADKMKEYFAVWIDNGHNDFSDPNTVILKIILKDGILLSDGKRYEIVF